MTEELESALDERWRYNGGMVWTMPLGPAHAKVTDQGRQWLAEVYTGDFTSGVYQVPKRFVTRWPTRRQAQDWATETILAVETERALKQAQFESLFRTITGRAPPSLPNIQNLPRPKGK